MGNTDRHYQGFINHQCTFPVKEPPNFQLHRNETCFKTTWCFGWHYTQDSVLAREGYTSNLRGWPDFPQEFVWPRLEDRLAFVGLFHMNDGRPLHLGAPVASENPASVLLAVRHHSSHLHIKKGLCYHSSHRDIKNCLCHHFCYLDTKNSLCHHAQVTWTARTVCVTTSAPWHQEQFVSLHAGHLDNRNTLLSHTGHLDSRSGLCHPTQSHIDNRNTVILHRSPRQQRYCVIAHRSPRQQGCCVIMQKLPRSNEKCHHTQVTQTTWTVRV